MITSKLTRKAQTTVPHAIRIALHLHPGDDIAYEIREGQVLMTKASRTSSIEDPFMTFYEWGEKTDCQAYGEL